MKKPVQSNLKPGKAEGISRREMVQKLVGGASTGVIAAAVATTQPSEARAINAATPGQESVKGTEWNALVLDPHQAQTLVVVAEIMVPGSTKAEVTPFIDLLLSVDTVENREQFIAALSAVDGEALRRFDAPFTVLTGERQTEIVTAASKSADAPGAGGQDATSDAQPKSANALHFENLKGWISKAYYSSEIGMRELGWSDSYFYASLPECDGTTS